MIDASREFAEAPKTPYVAVLNTQLIGSESEAHLNFDLQAKI